MKHLKKYNEGLLDGEDFLFKEITNTEWDSWNNSHEIVEPSDSEVLWMKSIISKAFVFECIRSNNSRWVPISHKVSIDDNYPTSYEFYKYDDNWWVINVLYKRLNSDGDLSFDNYLYLCDNKEGVEEFAKNIIK